MLRRLYPFILIIGWLGLATLSHALPPPNDLAKREKRNLAARPTPTPTPTPAPFIQPFVAPPATPAPTRSTGQTVTRKVPASVATRAPAPVATPVITRATAPATTRVAAPRTTTTTSTRTRESIPPENRPSTIVVVDAGHGGFDRGGIPRQRVPEKTMTLDVALRLRDVLQASGYRVVMTRDTDVFVPLGTRVAIANSYRNAIFVCIHFNAAPRSGANGIETYFYSSQSLALASAIHYHVAGGAPTPNRGVRRRGFFVLRRTTIPSVLVECGFLTNATEANYVQSASYRQKLAEEIAAGVRGRSQVTTSGSSRVAVAGTVPLQPFIDQTRVHDPDLSRKRSKKSSKSKSSKHRISSDTDEEKKTSTKKKSARTSEESDDSGGSKKKSAKKTSSASDDEGGAPKKKSSKKTSSETDDSGSSKRKKSSTTQPEN